MHTPREPHLTVLKRILRYLRGSLDYGLLLRPSPTSELVVYTDADWAGCPTRAGPPPVTPCSSVPTSSLGPPNGSSSSLAPALRPSTASWPTAWQRPPGYDNSSTSSTVPFSAPLSSTATTSARSTSPPIPCSISA
jgi:hypothetical protein